MASQHGTTKKSKSRPRLAKRFRKLPKWEQQLLEDAVKSGQAKLARNAQMILGFALDVIVSTLALIAVLSESQTRRIIRNWIEQGYEGIVPGKSPGRRVKFGETEIGLIKYLLKQSPQPRKTGHNAWTLALLKERLAKEYHIVISKEMLRLIIHREGFRHLYTRTWENPKKDRYAPKKPDPQAKEKWARIVALKKKAEEMLDGQLFSFDTAGNFSLIPQGGKQWAARRRPATMEARYKKDKGTWAAHMAQDLKTGKLYGIVRRRKRAEEIIELMRKLRKLCSKEVRQFIIVDCSPTHISKKLTRFMAKNNMEFVFTATYSSWMNPVEAMNSPMKRAVVGNSWYDSPREASHVFHAYMRRHNRLCDESRRGNITGKPTKKQLARLHH